MRTWSATPRQVLWKLRWPSAVPYLFASLKVAITISLIGAIVAELPTGAEAGIGARLLAGSYYGQTIQIWAALVAAAIVSSGLIGIVGLIERGVDAPHGSALMDPRKLRLGFVLAARRASRSRSCCRLRPASRRCGCGPRSGLKSPAAGLSVRCWRRGSPIAAPRCRACSAWCWRPPPRSCCCAMPGIAGSASGGFWAIVIAAWLASAMCVIGLAALRPVRAERRRALNLLVPLLFGAIVFYLWEVAVRGFGVPPVLLPAPSAAAARFAASLPTLAADFFQTFVKGVLDRLRDRLRRRICWSRSWRIALNSSAADCCRSAISFRRCRWSASRRSW